MNDEYKFGDPKPEPKQKKANKFVDPNKVKPYKCTFCKEKFYMPMWKYAERSKTPLKATCEDPGCKAKALMKRVVEPDRKLKAAQKRKSKAKAVRDNWDRREWKENIQKIINWIVKQLDKGHPCIARPGEATLRFDAGHFFSISSCSWLRFDMHNIHKQSSNSNQFKSGDYHIYRDGLIGRYGHDYVEMVDERKRKYRGLQNEFTILNMEKWYVNCLDVRKRIKKGEMFTRDEVNEMIGIYK